MKDFINKLNYVADKLYKGDVDYGIASMGEILSELGDIVTGLDMEKQNYLISKILTPMYEAMQEKDGTYLADLINYELLIFLNSMIE